jgi:hypothetical protein
VLAEEPTRDDAPVQEEASAETIAPEVIHEEALKQARRLSRRPSPVPSPRCSGSRSISMW